jgi:hypothetical protein
MIGAEDSLAVTQQLSLQLDGLRDPPAPAEAYGKVAPRDECVRVIGAEHPLPVEQHLTEDLERLVHLIIPAQTGTKVVAGEQGTGMIRTQDALLIAEQLRQDIKRLVQRAGLGEPVSQVIASKQSVGVIRTEDSQLALMFGAARWKDVASGEHSYRFGVALRALVVVSDIKVSGALTLPVVAAKVELEGARASAQLMVRGYVGSDLGALLPTWQSFGVAPMRSTWVPCRACRRRS